MHPMTGHLTAFEVRPYLAAKARAPGPPAAADIEPQTDHHRREEPERKLNPGTDHLTEISLQSTRDPSNDRDCEEKKTGAQRRRDRGDQTL